MVAPSGGKIDIVATKILVETQQASASLKKFNMDVDKSATRLQVAKALANDYAKGLGSGFKDAKKPIEDVNSTLQASTKELGNVSQGMEQTGNKGTNAFSKVLSATNILNIAFGILA